MLYTGGTMMKAILRKIKRIIVVFYCSMKTFLEGLFCLTVSISGIDGKRCKPEIQSDKSVLLLGNGPSLNNLDLDILSKKYDVACVNWFVIKDISRFLKIKPRYYFLLDPGFFLFGLESRTEEELNTLYQNLSELKNIFESIDWEMTLIIPQVYNFSLNNKHIKLKTIAVRDICGDYLKKYLYFLYKNNFALCGSQNVLCGALHYFIMNKFKIVYISGADMNEFKAHSVDERNHVICEFTHFYGNDIIDRTEAGHIMPGEFYKFLGYYVKMLKEFHYLREFADFQGVKVINLSPYSFIDSFEKIEWRKLL